MCYLLSNRRSVNHTVTFPKYLINKAFCFRTIISQNESSHRNQWLVYCVVWNFTRLPTQTSHKIFSSFIINHHYIHVGQSLLSPFSNKRPECKTCTVLGNYLYELLCLSPNIMSCQTVKLSSYLRTTRFNTQKLYLLPTHCIYVYCVDLRTDDDFCPILH